MSQLNKTVSAVVLAAGLSSRMGEPKQLLPYGKYTVIEQVVSVLQECSLQQIMVVTGHERQAIEARLASWPVHPIFNPQYRSGEMLSSVQIGLSALGQETDAALIVLGDQPRLEVKVVEEVLEAYRLQSGRLIIPSFQMRRGHPILIDRLYWPEILALSQAEALRKVINSHADDIYYVTVETDSVLSDIDTPEQYQQELQRRAAKRASSTR